MAQTKKKRRKKRRGTQSGRVDTRRGPKPRNRQEAQARARSRNKGAKGQRPDRRDVEPTWRSAFIRGAVASGLFVVIVALVFQRPIGPALGLGALMLAFYVPMGYFIDRFFYNRRKRQAQAARQAGKDS